MSNAEDKPSEKHIKFPWRDYQFSFIHFDSWLMLPRIVWDPHVIAFKWLKRCYAVYIPIYKLMAECPACREQLKANG